MPPITLRRLVENHLTPKWWQLWRKRKYHVCNAMEMGFSDQWIIYGMGEDCSFNHAHGRIRYAEIRTDRIFPTCHDGCKEIIASDPDFFKKLDIFLERECHDLA